MTTEVPKEISLKRPFNGSTERVVKLLLWMVTVTASVATAWAVLRGAVDVNTSQLKEACIRTEKLEDRVQVTEQFMYEQKIHNEWTRTILTEIKEDVKDKR